MELDQLEEFYELYPNATDLKIYLAQGKNENLEFLTKFENLSTLQFDGDYEMRMPIQFFTNFVKKLKKGNKLEKIYLHVTETSKTEDIYEFYKILFEKTNLIHFGRIKNVKEDVKVAEIISSWIKSNSIVQKVNLNCTFLLFIFKFLQLPRLDTWI
jgi:hypothetical protein